MSSTLGPAVPLADAPVLARAAARTRVRRLGLAAAIAVVAVAGVLAARAHPVHHSSFFPAGESGLVVLDFSNSINEAGYRRITNVLRPVVEANQPIGIVYFSDVGYLALPPATPGRELRPFLRFLETAPPVGEFASQLALDRASKRQPLEDTPWSAAFRGGTRISQGLEVARTVLRRAGLAQTGTVLLISDLDDSQFDLNALGDTLTRYRSEGIDLRIVPLSPAEEDRAFFRRVVGQQAFVTHAELLRNASSTQERSLEASFPLAVVLLGVGLLMLLAVNELMGARLDWGPLQPGAAP